MSMKAVILGVIAAVLAGVGVSLIATQLVSAAAVTGAPASFTSGIGISFIVAAVWPAVVLLRSVGLLPSAGK